LEPFKIGDVVAGKYEITRVLGQGGMGVDMEACCGDRGGGLFVCRPPEQGR